MRAEYKAKYLCRLCKKEYRTGLTTGRAVAAKETMLMLHNLARPDMPELLAVHYCDNGGIGVADFIGWERADDQKGKEAAADGTPKN